jgi:hypothetical protein
LSFWSDDVSGLFLWTLAGTLLGITTGSLVAFCGIAYLLAVLVAVGHFRRLTAMLLPSGGARS